MIAVLLAGAPLRAEEPADSIQAVITSQLSAFQANDLDAAFAHASPTIQTKFRNPEIFGEMVATGYPMIWRPAGYEMLDLRQTSMGVLRGRLRDAPDRRRLADRWRLSAPIARRRQLSAATPIERDPEEPVWRTASGSQPLLHSQASVF
jgi:hypothetical protein